jgi:hypothetical protein
MQRINRGVEITVFLLQPGQFGPEFALVFVGHDISLTAIAKGLRSIAGIADRISSLPAKGASRARNPPYFSKNRDTVPGFARRRSHGSFLIVGQI